jgi:hypothetical protein
MWLFLLLGAQCTALYQDPDAVEAFVEFDGNVIFDGEFVEVEDSLVGVKDDHTVGQFCISSSIPIDGISVEDRDGVDVSISPTLTFPIEIGDFDGLGVTTTPGLYQDGFEWTVSFTPTENEWSADIAIDAGTYSTRFTVTSADEGLLADLDGDGVIDDEDCELADPSLYPGAPELCNDVDDDCDDKIDEGLDRAVYYPDFDGDGYGDPAGGLEDCDPPQDYVTDGSDCDDTRDSVNPGAIDAAGDGVDADCDGVDCTIGELDGTRFGVCTGEFDWDQSRALCAIAFDDITSIRSATEQSYLISLLGEAGYDFGLIGFTDAEDEGVFRWADGSGSGYTAWADGEPNDTNDDEDCSAIQGSAGYGWNDVPCSLVTSIVICQDRP